MSRFIKLILICLCLTICFCWCIITPTKTTIQSVLTTEPIVETTAPTKETFFLSETVDNSSPIEEYITTEITYRTVNILVLDNNNATLSGATVTMT